MKNKLALVTLMTLTTSISAVETQDFVGTYKLLSGDVECEQSLVASEVTREGSLCLSLKRKSPGMDWARTEKVCNINEVEAVSVDDIPAPIFLGTITSSDFAAMDASTLYHSSLQVTEYVDGRVFRLQNESYLSFNEHQELVFENTSVGIEGAEFTRTYCTYRAL